MIDTKYTLEELNAANVGNMAENMGIVFTEINAGYLKAKMPVDHRTVQPIGILNGGASAALAETVGSLASYLCIDRKAFYTVGLEIKCNHISSAAGGFVSATAKPAHLGKRTHVWQIQIVDEAERLVCLSTLTMQVLPLEPNSFAHKMLQKSPLSAFSD
ncbi:hotdog fold thioesterase [bacterium]|nr:hotdog fold thioesterase [bacterium]